MKNYGLIEDGTIVKICVWSEEKFEDFKGGLSREIHFTYRFFDRFIKYKNKKRSAWCYESDFIAFSNNIKELKRIKRQI